MPPPNGGVRRGCLAYLSVSFSARQGRKCGVTFSLAVDAASGQRSKPWRLRRSLGIAPRQPRENRGGGFLEAAATSERGSPIERATARRGPVAPRSLGGRRRGRGQRASTVSTSATSARRRPGTAPRPEAARARASNSDVLQGEASITSRRRHRVARPALNLKVTTISFPRALETRRILAAACAGDEQRFGRFRAWAAREQNVLRRPRTTSSRRPSPRTRFRRRVPEP